MEVDVKGLGLVPDPSIRGACFVVASGSHPHVPLCTLRGDLLLRLAPAAFSTARVFKVLQTYARIISLSLAGILVISFSLAYGQGSSLLLQESRWDQGKRYLAEGKAREAKGAFEDLLKNYPEEPDLHLFLGIASLRLRNTQAAEIHIRRVLNLAPDHVEARTLLGWLKLEVHRDYASAIEEYARVVQLRPGFPEAYNNLGVAFKKKGELEKAIENFNRALELRGDYGEAWSNRGWVYAEQEKWREAQGDFKRALELNPDDEGALYGLSRVLRELRDYAGAQEALSRLIVQSPNFVYWLEWGQLQLVRYYWVLLLVAAALFLRARYRKVGGKSYGSRGDKET
ncbi:MAG: tetratricopeptide repeat protein [Deltaproteobacteria bacterium]|nr:tetratricopeptide repeat protein [Deltaproteobacteria bacterium]